MGEPAARHRTVLRGASLLVLALLGCADAAEQATPAAGAPTRLRAEVLATYPHDAGAFTQGLVWHDRVLYESTGLYGRSSLRAIDPATGAVQRRVELPPSLFGEGLAWADGQLVQLTWREGVALRWNPATFARDGELRYAGEGWGLCYDGRQFVQSDGSQRLIFRDRTSFAVTRQLAVTRAGAPLKALNELECVGDTVYANVWLTDRIVAIAALNGVVRAEIDASNLLTAAERAALGREAILNGIAYDPSDRTFLLTGKLWPKLFRVRFVPAP